MSHRRLPLRTSALLPAVLALTAATCQSEPPGRGAGGTAARAAASDNGSIDMPRAPLVIPTPAPAQAVSASPSEQKAFMLKAARSAWNFVTRSTSPAGFVGATDTYPYMTVWDMASQLAAIYSARQLAFISAAQYRRAVDRSLGTIERMPLFDNAAFNKLYAAQSGAMVDRKNAPSTRGYGWSVIDHGRLLVWLRIIGNSDSAFAPRAQAIVSRLNMSRLIQSGYLHGEDLDPATGGTRSYQEGRVGYEQYAAEGFALWGARAAQALDFAANGKPVTVNEQTVLADTRGNDLLTSEPFVMMGLELGWTGPTWRPLSLAMLAAQEARFRKEGIVTMVSEDAVPDPPAYFYYYLLYHDGAPFVVTTPAGEMGSTFPRWVSAKAAFGYHALAPSDYTWRALQAVKWGSVAERGWTAGVYEGTKRSTKAFNLNTAAVVLESALYFQRGCPLIQRTCPDRPAD